MGYKPIIPNQKKSNKIKIGLMTALTVIIIVAVAIGLLWLAWPDGFGENGVLTSWFKAHGGDYDSQAESADDESYDEPFDSDEPDEDSEAESRAESREDSRQESTVPDLPALDMAFFDKAVFIGDGRTALLRSTTGLTYGRTLAAADMAVDLADSFELAFFQKKDGSQGTVIDILKEEQFEKIYLNFGYNELDWDTMAGFTAAYSSLIGNIQKLQPNATVYVQAILPVTAEKSGVDEVFNNHRIEMYNNSIRQMAQNLGVKYLAVNEAVADSNGALPAEYASSDGVRFGRALCWKWLEYLIKNSK